MGDRIAILRDHSEIAQLDTPEHILTDPADEFVENFLGSGAILKTLTLRRVRDIDLSPLVTLKEPFQRDDALRRMNEANSNVAVLLDAHDNPIRWVDEKALNRSSGLEKAGKPITVQLQPEDTLQDALAAMLTSAAGLAVVVDGRGHYVGGCSVESLAQLLIQTGQESAGS